MTGETTYRQVSPRLRMAGLLLVYAVTLAELVRSSAELDDLEDWLWYGGLLAAYLVLFTLVVLRPPARHVLRHIPLAVQCLIVLLLFSFDPLMDFMTVLYVPLAFQAAMSFPGRTPWYWVAALAALTAGSLMWYLGSVRGLALALVIVALEIVFAAYVVVAGEIESARRRSQVMVDEVESTHVRLRSYAAQAGELAAAEERDRVARDLNDSVANSISAILETTAEAREAVATGPGPGSADERADDAGRLLATLQAQTQQALAQMRGLIAELRPKAG
jgi:signal transduction histidine kinase